MFLYILTDSYVLDQILPTVLTLMAYNNWHQNFAIHLYFLLIKVRKYLNILISYIHVISQFV